MNLLGKDRPDSRCALAYTCGEFRSPTPMQDVVYSLLARSQRRTLWVGITLTVVMLLGVMLFAEHALASTDDRRQEIATTLQHQAEQDRDISRLEAAVERTNQRQIEDEQQLNRIVGFGGGLGCLAIFLQLVQLLNTRTTANQVLQVVRDRESNANAAGRGR